MASRLARLCCVLYSALLHVFVGLLLYVLLLESQTSYAVAEGSS